MRSKAFWTGGALALLFCVPASGRADTVVTGFGGAAFGGDIAQTEAAWGGDISFLADRTVGLGIDFSYVPDFFGKKEVLGVDTNVTTLMANVVLAAPFGHGEPSRFYVSAGGGLMRSRVPRVSAFFESISRNDFGIDAGAGILAFVSENVGIRGDIRYFRDLHDLSREGDIDLDVGKFDFWRGTAGLSIRF